MIELVDVDLGPGLADYAAEIELAPAVAALRDAARAVLPRLSNRTVWMINSAARGGGVAEMLPRLVSLLRELGVDTRWVVITPDNPEFFALTKRLHNLLHGSGDPELGPRERTLYDATSDELAAAFIGMIGPKDLVVVHDPQPAGVGARLKRALGTRCVWRCHIGVDEDSPQTRAAWAFLRADVDAYDQTVFTAPEYIPPFLGSGAAIIPPALDPFSHKNRRLSPHKLTGVLVCGGLTASHHPTLAEPFMGAARRLEAGSGFVPALDHAGLGLLFRPVVTQISRWDRLKGFAPLLEAFVRLKREADRFAGSDRDRERIRIVRLVLAGPDADSVRDDPEAQDVLETICRRYLTLPRELHEDIAVLQLPMVSTKENALMVNALQRCSTVVAQCSLREGFGLTVTEAMWKGIAVLGSSACGIRHQIEDRVHGRRVADPRDAEELAGALAEMLNQPYEREHWGARARRRVHDEFLVFAQVRRWLELLASVGQEPPRTPSA